MPRKFSEKIAIQQRKLNEDQSAFDQIMAEVHSITKKFEPDVVDVGLFPGSSLRSGRSLPNVHHISSGYQDPYMDNCAWLNSKGDVVECSDRFVIHPSRDRYPGSQYHYSPYHRSLSPQVIMPADRCDGILGRQLMKPLQSQRYLQPPPDGSWRRTHSDPVLHSSVAVGSQNPGYPVLTSLNQSFSPPTHSPPLNDSSSCGSPLCEACASPYYICSKHEKLFGRSMIAGDSSSLIRGGREMNANVYVGAEPTSSPPVLNATSPTDTANSDECPPSSGLLSMYANHVVCAGAQDGMDDPTTLSSQQQYAQVQQQQPRTSFSQYRDSTHSAPCSPCESVSTNEGQSSSPVPTNISPSTSYYMLPSPLQNFFVEPARLAGEVPDYGHELLADPTCNAMAAASGMNELSPEYMSMPNAVGACQNVFQVPMAPDYGASSVSHKGNIPDIILTGADGSVRNSGLSSSSSSPLAGCTAYYGVHGEPLRNASTDKWHASDGATTGRPG